MLAAVCVQAPAQVQQPKPVTMGEFVVLMDLTAIALRRAYIPTATAPKPVPHGYKGALSPKVDAALASLVSAGVMPAGKGAGFDAGAPVTRYALAVALDKMFQALKPHFLRTAEPKSINLQRIKGRAEDGSQAAMERLCRANVLPLGSPVFEGPSPNLLPKTMSAVLAQAIERIGWYFRKKDSDLG